MMKQSGYLLVLLLAAVVISGCTVVVGDSSGDVGGWIYVPAGSQMSGASAEIEPLFLDQATPPYGYEPAVGVTVRVAGRSTKTDYEGYFYLRGVTAGGYRLTASGGPLRFAVERQVYVRANTITWLGDYGTPPIFGGVAYYVVIGVDKYGTDILPGIRANTEKVFESLFVDNKLAGFGRLLVRDRGWGDPTEANVRNSIRAAVEAAENENDYLVIYFSGRSGKNHLVDPSGTWITDGELESWVSDFPGNVTLIIDGTESATMADDDVLPMAFMKNKYTVISAARKGEEVFYDPYLDSSVFTYFLEEGITGTHPADLDRDRDITSVELHRYIYDKMAVYLAGDPDRHYPQIWPGFDGNSVIFRY